MASNLTFEALQHLRQDEDLKREILPYLDLKPNGLESAINRNSKALTTYFAVVRIAKRMGKYPETIIDVK